ncbi:MAG: DUF6458 family protein [Candidatus Rokuibacteriota bacterium]
MGYGGLGFGIFLVALGAILRYAVTAEVANIDIGTVGVILMVAGVVLFLITLFFMLTGRPPSRGAPPPPPPPPSY